MYVCVCNAVTDRDIEKAVDNGIVTFQDLRQELNVATCCGRCETCAKNILNDCHNKSCAAA